MGAIINSARRDFNLLLSINEQLAALILTLETRAGHSGNQPFGYRENHALRKTKELALIGGQLLCKTSSFSHTNFQG